MSETGKLLKGMIGITAMTPLVGETLGMIGTNMTGALSGIGRATQSFASLGFMGHTMKAMGTNKWFKW